MLAAHSTAAVSVARVLYETDKIVVSPPPVLSLAFVLQCRLKVSLQYKSIGEDPTYGAGVGAGQDAGGVPNTYFPMRRGCNVHLYSDAHQVLLSPACSLIYRTQVYC